MQPEQQIETPEERQQLLQQRAQADRVRERIEAHASRVAAEEPPGPFAGRAVTERNRLGSARATPVRCVTTGQTYPSASDAGGATGIPVDSIRWSCSKGRPIRGYQFEYAGDPARVATARMRPVHCIESGVTYD